MVVVLSAFATSTVLGGAASVPSRRPVTCAPRSAGITCAFQRRKFPLVSFSWGGDPRREVLVEVEEEAKAEDEEVVSAPMVLAIMAAVVVDMLLT